MADRVGWRDRGLWLLCDYFCDFRVGLLLKITCHTAFNIWCFSEWDLAISSLPPDTEGGRSLNFFF